MTDHPIYTIRDDMIWRTVWHPDGASRFPVFEIRSGQVFETAWNEMHPDEAESARWMKKHENVPPCNPECERSHWGISHP